MNLKVQYLLALALLLAIGCRKERITDDSTTTIDPPTQVETAVVSGVVINNGDPVPGASIEVYEGETLKGTLTANAKGEFNTGNLSLKLGTTVTFLAKKDALVTTPKRIVANAPAVSNVKINMPDPGLSFSGPINYDNPGSANWVNISGYITGPDGTPAPNVTVGILYGLVPLGTGFEAAGSWFVFTDENGYYEGLLPRDSVLYLFASQTTFGQYHFSCESNFLNQSDVPFSGLPLENLGAFNEDTQLPTLNNAYIPANVAKITGTVADCNGDPLTDFSIDLSVKFGPTSILSEYSTTIDFTSGQTFKYTMDLCNGPIKEIKMRAKNNVTGKKSEIKTFTNVSTSFDFGTLLTCQ
jgi:hypothetical protein